MSTRKKKILILDDDLVNGTLLQRRLTCEEYECVYLQNPIKCLERLESEDFDIVLLDIIMPTMSGHEVLRRIRETKSSVELPVIMVTAKEEAEDIVVSLHRGANDYLTKPINTDIAKARVKTHVNLKYLHQNSLDQKQIETIHKMVSTLNDKINNPLAIAVGNLTILGEYYSKTEKEFLKIQKSLTALERISDLVKKIDSISNIEVEEIKSFDKNSMFEL